MTIAPVCVTVMFASTCRRTSVSALIPVIDTFATHASELILVGYADLLIEHAADARLAQALDSLLRDCESIDVYRYAVTAIVASRRADLLGLLVARASNEGATERVEVLVEGLALLRGDGEVERLMGELRARLGAGLRTEN